MQLNDLLIKKDVDPKDVLVFRHRPMEPELREILPWLAEEKPEVYNAYQQAQWPRAEKAMMKAKYVASFIGHEARKAVFVGLFKVEKWKTISRKKFWQIPANCTLKSYGMMGLTVDRPRTLWFELTPCDFHPEWKGKLVVKWPGLERSWWRWADRNKMLIDAIPEESLLVQRMPDWTKLTFSWEKLKALPREWREKISQWRGVYLILDESDGKGYVGSAYGRDNILGRWLSYAKSGHGGNKQLRNRDPRNFRFSILERVSPDMGADEAVNLESTWKERLGTKRFGLNDN